MVFSLPIDGLQLPVVGCHPRRQHRSCRQIVEQLQIVLCGRILLIDRFQPIALNECAGCYIAVKGLRKIHLRRPVHSTL